MKRLAALALLVCLLSLPHAAAQQDPDVALDVTGWKALQEPGMSRQIHLNVEYNCAKIHPNGSRLTLRLTDTPDWALAGGQFRVTIDPQPQACLTNDVRLSENVTWQLGVLDGAPAHQPADMVFNATINMTDGEQSGEDTRTIQAAFVGRVQASITSQATVRPDQESIHNITIRNRGNGPIQVTLNVQQVDTGLQLTLPEPPVIDTGRNGTTSSWTDRVRASATIPRQTQRKVFEAVIQVETTFAGDATVAGDSTNLPVKLIVERPQDEGEGLPGFQWSAVVVAAGAALLWTRRRSRGR